MSPFPLRKSQAGILDELSPMPHPWLYAEVARVGLGIGPDENGILWYRRQRRCSLDHACKYSSNRIKECNIEQSETWDFAVIIAPTLRVLL